MKTTSCALAVALLPCVSISADVITVDDDGLADYSTIQAAIDAAFEGDEIQVFAGYYLEAIDFNGKAIAVEGVEGPIATGLRSPIDHNGPTVRFATGEGTGSMLSGFKIGGGTGGLIEDPVFGTSLAGGGIYCVNTSPMIFNCNIVGTTIDGSGAGMVIVRGDPWVVDCNFIGNEAAGHGGGIYVLDNADPIITGCTFENNSASWGGGVTCTVSCNPTFTDCTFKANTVINVGGGMYVRSSSSPLLTNCRFEQNVQVGNPFSGGGGFTTYGSGNGGGPCYPELVGCSFEGNRAEANGGAVHAAYSGNVTMTGCTFFLNSADDFGGAVAVVGDPAAPTTVHMTSCIVEDNSSFASGGGLNSFVSTVNIEDCQFRNNMAADMGGGCNFDASASSAVSGSILCGNFPDQAAGEWNDAGNNTQSQKCVPECDADLNGDGNVDGADLTIVLAAWGGCEVIDCDADINDDGVVDGADLTTILGDWGPCR